MKKAIKEVGYNIGDKYEDRLCLNKMSKFVSGQNEK